MRKFGFKIFSSNLQNRRLFIEECARFVAEKKDMFIEVMIVGNASKENLFELKDILQNVEVRIHAPHSSFGFDPGNKCLEKQNRKMFETARFAADLFNSKTIVVHSGGGNGIEAIKETARQFNLFNDNRIVVENLPYFDDDGKLLSGNTAEEIAYIMNESGCGFCFDFSHAICAALSLHINMEKQLQDFFDLNPSVYHLCDGNTNQAEDLHLHYGEGNYPLAHLLNDFTADDAYITMETGSNIAQTNKLWVSDYNYLKSLEKNSK